MRKFRRQGFRLWQKIIAFIVLRNEELPLVMLDISGLEQFTATLINGSRLPDKWVQVAALPAPPLGKLDRKKLQQLAAQFGSRP